jgi:hypothetical protein
MPFDLSRVAKPPGELITNRASELVARGQTMYASTVVRPGDFSEWSVRAVLDSLESRDNRRLLEGRVEHEKPDASNNTSESVILTLTSNQ